MERSSVALEQLDGLFPRNRRDQEVSSFKRSSDKARDFWKETSLSRFFEKGHFLAPQVVSEISNTQQLTPPPNNLD